MIVLYDLETSGLLTTFDQILEFASITCNEDLCITDKIEYKVKITRDTIPSLEALNILPNLPSLDHGLSEEEALIQIHRIMQSQKYYGGYNNLRFDDEILRFSFYRHHLHPYANNFYSSKLDLYPITAMYNLIHKNRISWPKKTDGSISLKLEDLNKNNNWLDGSSHSALFDVEVTLYLLKTLKSIDDKLFNFLLGYFNKKIDEKRMNEYLQPHHHYSYAYLFDPAFGSKDNYIGLFYYLGRHPEYQQQTIWQDASTGKIIFKKFGMTPWVLPNNILKYIEHDIKLEKFEIKIPEKKIYLEDYDPEADLYTNNLWINKIENKFNANLNAWRYKNIDAQGTLIDYCEYLKTGNGPKKIDHLGRKKRSFDEISKEKLNNSSPKIQILYEKIIARLK